MHDNDNHQDDVTEIRIGNYRNVEDAKNSALRQSAMNRITVRIGTFIVFITSMALYASDKVGALASILGGVIAGSIVAGAIHLFYKHFVAPHNPYN